MNGPVRIENKVAGNTVVKDNVGTPESKRWEKQERKMPRPHGFRAHMLRRHERHSQ